MSKDIFRSQFRLPWDLYEQLKESAEEAGRSLNAEIVFRLEASFLAPSPIAVRQAPEMRKVELLLDFESWASEQTPTQEKNFKGYCQLYNSENPGNGQVEAISGIDEVDAHYLRELAVAWRRYARESTYLAHEDPTRFLRLVEERRKGELVLGYLDWCKQSELDPLAPEALDNFCKAYKTDGIRQIRGKIIDIPEVLPDYLEKLVAVWIYEVAPQSAGGEHGNRLGELVKALHQQQLERLDAIEDSISLLAGKLEKK
ncbi:hypothetical protein C2134_20340 [Chromobacterium sinusclupearum]|uniref:Arc-like DNA binding domain-containing protein n=1 Tax=Chromobacterium sinusclupearum TaxID=2077146 RepID=A0A2K4MII6_9NEIS|nr:Arc family DNA-binding protein [Chromobacterium sinusclupearum]POA96896.1 hypothetical protein C2134_20340 [Chromobacterium sinusclupearum]